MGKPQSVGGLGWGDGTVVVGLTIVILCLVVYLGITRRDVQQPRRAPRHRVDARGARMAEKSSEDLSRDIRDTAISTADGGPATAEDRPAWTGPRLDFAIRHGYEHSSWCPRDRRAKDGFIPPHYELHETDSPDYVERTEQNVLDADATLIVAPKRKLSGGTAFTKSAPNNTTVHFWWCVNRGVSRSAAALSKFIRRQSARSMSGRRGAIPARHRKICHRIAWKLSWLPATFETPGLSPGEDTRCKPF